MNLQAQENAKSDGSLSARKLRQIHQLWAATMVCGALIATPQVTRAADHPVSGQQNSPVIIVEDDVTVVTSADFGVNTPTGDALNISGAGAISYSDTNSASLVTTNNFDGIALSMTSTGDNGPTPGSVTINTGGNITGGNTGILTRNYGTGTTSITTTGDVEGTGNAGMMISNDIDTTGLTVDANNVTGGSGISVNNAGTGVVRITTTGDVEATSGDGISIGNSGNTTSVAIIANNINASNFGTNVQNFGGGTTSITTTGDVTGTNGFGIYALTGMGATDVTINANNVTAGLSGIYIENGGTGTTSITATGDVTGMTANGISVTTYTDTTGLTIDVNNVTGATNGIDATNNGGGTTSITATGNVTGTTGNGIDASTDTATTGLTIDANNVTGGTTGIYATNYGAGSTNITTTGTLTGLGDQGMYVYVDSVTNTGGVTINAATVNAETYGITVNNYGTGNTDITVTGTITANTVHGIIVDHYGADLTIETTDISAGETGIVIGNRGLNLTRITTTGTVTAGTKDAIYIDNDNALNTGGVVVSTETATGNENGITLFNRGLGNTSVTATGTVTGTTSTGIYILHSGADLTVEAVGVTGGLTGLRASNTGSGLTDITTTGTVTGLTGEGISAYSSGNGGMTISTAAVRGATNGIAASYEGTGLTSITTNGVVEGGDSGIYLSSSSTQASTVTIEAASEVRNTSLAPTSLAIETDGNAGGITNIINEGRVTGTASLGNQNDTFNNIGVWNTAGGTSTFLGGSDILNNSGAFLAANTTGSVNTTLEELEAVNHTGAIVMQNTDARIGGLTAYVGDNTTFTNGGTGNFQSNGGGLFIDTDIFDGISDTLTVDNVSVSGAPTTVFVNALGPGRVTSGDGILVVDVDDSSANDAFVLAAPVQSGLFNYNLNQGNIDNQSWFLQSNLRDEVVSSAALSILGSRTALSTLSNLNERQRGGEGFTDDQTGRKGIWARVFGQDNKFRSDGGSQAGYDANTWSAQAGFDLLAEKKENGARKYAGLYIGHATSNGDALNGSDRVGRLDVDATSVGAYFTKYSAKGWYADAIVQYSKLDGVRLRTADNTLRPDGKSYLASLELGQRFNEDKKIVPELQAQLIYQSTDFDNVTLSDSTRLNIGEVNSVTGRLGVRLTKNPAYAGRFQPWLRANLWHTFKGGAKITSQGATANTPFGGTSGEVQLGLAYTPTHASGWSAYVVGGYLFDLSGSEYSGWKGTLGVRKGW